MRETKSHKMVSKIATLPLWNGWSWEYFLHKCTISFNFLFIELIIYHSPA